MITAFICQLLVRCSSNIEQQATLFVFSGREAREGGASPTRMAIAQELREAPERLCGTFRAGIRQSRCDGV